MALITLWMGLITLWKNYLPWTQAVVVAPLIARARRPGAKVAWTLVLVGTTVVFIVQSGYLVKGYLEYKKTTNIRLIPEKEAPLPAITFCNLNPFKKSMVGHSQELTNLLTTYTYVNKKKQAQMKIGSTAAARTTTPSSIDGHVRSKRQASGCQETEYSYDTESSISQRYKVTSCSNGTAFMDLGDCNIRQPGSSNLPLHQLAAQVLASYCGRSAEACPQGTVSMDYSSYYHAGQCDDSMTTKIEDCNKPSLTGNNYDQSFTYSFNFTNSCDEEEDGHLKCVLVMQCSPVAAVELTTTESLIPSTTLETTTNPSISTLVETATAPLTSPTELSSTMSGALTSTTFAETITTEPVSTTTEPTTMTSMQATSKIEASTTSTATVPDATTTNSRTSSTTTTSEAHSATTEIQASSLISTSETATTTSPLASTPTTTGTSTTPHTMTFVETASTAKTSTIIVKATPVPRSSSASSTTATVTTTTASSTKTTDRTDTTSTVANISSTTAVREVTSPITDAQTSTSTSTYKTASTTTSLARTPTTTETSTTSQGTTTVEPTSKAKTSTTNEKNTSVSTSSSSTTSMTAPGTTATSSQASSANLTKSTNAYPTSAEARTSSASTLLTQTETLGAASSTHGTLSTLITTMTEPGTSTSSEKSMISTQRSISTTTTRTGSPLTTMRGSSTMSPSVISPTETSSILTTLEIPTPLTIPTMTIASTRPTTSSTSTNGGSLGSSETSATESTTQVSTTASDSVRATRRSITTASAEGAGLPNASQGSTSTETSTRQRKSTPGLPLTKTTVSHTESSNNSNKVGTTSTAATNHLESTVTTVRATVASARTTDSEVIATDLASISSSLTPRTLPTATSAYSNMITIGGTEVATMSTSDRSSQHSYEPSATILTHVGGTGRPYSITSPEEEGESSAATTQNAKPSSGAHGSSRRTPSSSAATRSTESTSNDFITVEDCVDCKETDAVRTQPNTLMPASPASLNGHDTWSTTDVEGHESDESTLPNLTVTSATKSTGQGSGATTRSGITSTPSTGGLDRTTTSSATPGTAKSSTKMENVSSAPPTNDGSSSTTAQTERSAIGKTMEFGSTVSFSRPATIPSEGPTQTKESSSTTLPTTKPTTSYEDQSKNIQPELGLDFDLADLTEEQTKKFEHLSKAYELDPSNNQVLMDANMKQALQIVAAKMTPEQRQVNGFQLKELVSSCIINGEPCDMVSDFKQTFDVDYGNCYTFNYDMPIKHVTRQTGSSYGLRMTIFSNSTETLPSSSEEGVKIVLHSQDIMPFPNVEGYRGPVGTAVSLQVTYGKFSKLGLPYGNCSTLESITENKQPFYYNGSYSTEGCLRSCFQRNIASACGCADSRFPSPTDMNVPFCDPLEPTKYNCMKAYIEDNGDYFFVGNCQCYDACEDTAYKSEISEAPWPAGSFFYGGFCPRAKKLDSADCSDFYSNNGMRLEVSFSQLGYEKIEEEPSTSAWALMNELAGNSGLWIGYTMVGFVEIVLVGIQILLWICGFPRLPEVPPLDHLEAESGEESGSEESDSEDSMNGDASDTESDNGSPGPSGSVDVVSMRHKVPPKNFDNALQETALTRREVHEMMPTELELYGQKQEYEPVDPVRALTSEHADHVAYV